MNNKFRSKRTSNKKYIDQIKNQTSNILIIFLLLLILGFIWSTINNYQKENTSDNSNFKDLGELLVISKFEKMSGHRIRAEVLNGCGITGIADKFTNLLRNKGVDVITSENADHFEYNNTKIISRTYNDEFALEVTSILGLEPENIYIESNDLLDCDITIIIGKDYKKLSSFNDAIKYSPPF